MTYSVSLQRLKEEESIRSLSAEYLEPSIDDVRIVCAELARRAQAAQKTQQINSLGIRQTGNDIVRHRAADFCPFIDRILMNLDQLV